MSLLKDAGVPTPKFGVATTVEEAKKIAEDLGTKDLVVKAQVGAKAKQTGKEIEDCLFSTNLGSGWWPRERQIQEGRKGRGAARVQPRRGCRGCERHAE